MEGVSMGQATPDLWKLLRGDIERRECHSIIDV
jgi:hypothetical protein